MDRFENHCQYCITVFGPSVLMAMIVASCPSGLDRPISYGQQATVIAAYQMWKNRNAPRLMPAVERVPIAFLSPVGHTATVIDTNWIDWKAYLELLFKVRRVV